MRTLDGKRVWLGHDFRNPLRVWKGIAGCEGILINAHQLLSCPIARDLAQSDGLGEVLGYDGPVFLDSGGFLFSRSGCSSLPLVQLLELARALNPNLTAALDIPLSPTGSNKQNYFRWRRTLRNTRAMADEIGHNLVPVIHSYSPAAVARRCDQIKEFYPSPKVIAIGSLVPLIRGIHLGRRFVRDKPASASFRLQRWTVVTRIITEARRAFPRSKIHVFGVGSVATTLLLFLVGVTSVDSVGWRLKASYGEIFLPESPSRNVSNRRAGDVQRRLTLAEHAQLEGCGCPACEGRGLQSQLRILGTCYHSRAVHNAYTLLQIVRLFRHESSQAARIAFVRQVLQSNKRMLNVLEGTVVPLLARQA